ncbi:MAG: exodeoxyribonuclease V subunit gamma [Spirochaetes bacterium]|nr:exodeoxyribonuclease V subunit gamma [Spirochaetota bacterium]
MGLKLIFSNDINDLIDQLKNDIKNYNKKDILNRIKLVVPNRNLKKYIQIKLSQDIGISTFIDFFRFEEFIFNFLMLLIKGIEEKNNIKKLNKKEDIKISRNIKVLNYSNNFIYLSLFILNIILEKYDDENFKIIKNYANDKNKFYYIWDIAEKLAFYLKEYFYHFPDLIKWWEKKEFLFDKISSKNYIVREIEAIYKKVFDELNIIFKEKFNKEEISYCFFYDLYKIAKNYFDKFIKNENSISQNLGISILEYDPVFYFGFSHISEFHTDFLLFISNFINVKFYSLFYPSYFSLYQSFVDYHNEKTLEKNFEEKLLEESNVTLTQFDKVFKKYFSIYSDSKEFIKKYFLSFYKNLRNQFSIFSNNKEKVEIAFKYSQLKKNSLLDYFKLSILGELNIEKFSKIEQDNSIQIFCAHSKKREIETVYNSIIYNLINDKDLNLNEIAILVTDIKSYIYEIKNVFDYYGLIKYNISDLKADSESNFYKAIISFLNLIESDLRRNEIIEFLINPIVMNKYKFTYNDIVNIIKVIKSLDIFYSYDIEDKRKYSYFEDLLFTWSYGLKRIRSGYLYNLISPNSYKISGYFEKYPPYIVYFLKNPEIFEKFNTFFESLFRLLKEAREAISFEDWVNIFKKLNENFFDFNEDEGIEKQIKSSFENILIEFKNYGNILDKSINVDLIKKIIKSEYQKIEVIKGNYIIDGVTISQINPMRPLPFKIIYLIGLNEDIYPSIFINDIFDLRIYNNNYMLKEEIDNYNFIETFFLCINKIYLSYVSKDLERDRILYPSNVLKDFISYLEENIIIDKFILFEVPFLIDENYAKYIEEKNYKDFILKNYTDIFYLVLEENIKLKEELIKESIEEKNNDLFNIEGYGLSRKEFYLNDLFNYILNPKRVLLKNIYNINVEKPIELIDDDIEPFYEDRYSFEEMEKLIFVELFYFIKNKKSKNDFNKSIIEDLYIFKFDFYKNFEKRYFDEFFLYIKEKIESGNFNFKLPNNFFRNFIYKKLRYLLKKIFINFYSFINFDLFNKLILIDSELNKSNNYQYNLKFDRFELVKEFIIDNLDPDFKYRYNPIVFEDIYIKGKVQNFLIIEKELKKIIIFFDFINSKFPFTKENLYFELKVFKNLKKNLFYLKSFIKNIFYAYLLFKVFDKNEISIYYFFINNSNSLVNKDKIVCLQAFIFNKNKILDYFENKENGLLISFLNDIKNSEIYEINFNVLFNNVLDSYNPQDSNKINIEEILNIYKEKIDYDFEEFDEINEGYFLEIESLLLKNSKDGLDFEKLKNRYLRIFDTIDKIIELSI